MAEIIPTKPYLVRAIHEWCVDNGLTPHLLVVVDGQTKVPMAFVKEGEIVLNLSYSATKEMHIDNEAISFSARFNGQPHQLYVPMYAVKGIFARENSQGLFFEVEIPDFLERNEKLISNKLQADDSSAQQSSSGRNAEKTKPSLKIVK